MKARFIYEAEIYKTRGIPKSFLEKTLEKAKREHGIHGPSREEFRRMNELLNKVFSAQKGNEEKLTQIGLNLIKKYYGSILEDVKIDAKIVPPDDPEKRKMVDKMIGDMQETEEVEIPTVEIPSAEIDLPKKDDPEVHKRKILNNIIQGEAQNVHSMIMDAKDEIDKIDPNLTKYYLEFLNLNKKFDWWEMANLEMAIKHGPEKANAMEVDWEGEGKDQTPVIKARGLDLPMLVHEVVKGIYELIASNAIDESKLRALGVLQQTDTLKDEQEDIKYGPYIAAEVRNYINECLDKVPGSDAIPNMREFIFGEMVAMPAEKFLKLMYAILEENKDYQKLIVEFIKKVKKEYEDFQKGTYVHVEKGKYPSEVEEEKPKKEFTEKDYKQMGQKELQYQLNQAIDTGDFKKAEAISKYIKESFTKFVSITLEEFLNEQGYAEPKVKPVEPEVIPLEPGIKPAEPKRRFTPTPIRRERPSVVPRPKATLDDVVKRFIKLVEIEEK